MAHTVTQQRVVEKLAAVIDVEPAQGKVHRQSQPFECLNHKRSLAQDQGDAFGSAAGDIREHKGVHVAARRGIAAMGHEIRFHIPGQRFTPLGEGPHRDALAQRRRQPSPFRCVLARAPLRSRSMVAALAARSLARMLSSSERCPCRSKAGTNTGRSGFKRFPHTRSEASHSTINA